MAVLLASLLWMHYPIASVSLRDGESELMLACWRLPPAASITLAYTHSMFGGDVRETFLVTTDSQLYRVAFRTERAAAADYYATTASVVPERGWYRVDAPPAGFTELAIRADAVGAPRIITNGEETALLTLPGQPGQVILTPHSPPGGTPGACA